MNGGENMNGILPLWKERGMTSHDCVFKLRKILKTKKIGHTGTLDPEVDGVLALCVGSATKAAEFMIDMDKSYTGEITLGYTTTTEDAHGEIVEKQAILEMPSVAEIDKQMETFLGEITQIPPMYSAVKVNGKRLYEYARKGEAVERPIRIAKIYSFKRTSEPVMDEEKQTVSWRFEVSCGKGTYVRTLAVNLGEQLGYPAHMSQLTRTSSGPFNTEDCFTLDQVREIMEEEKIADILRPAATIFTEYPQFELNEALWEKIKNGSVLEAESFPEFEGLIALHYQNNLVALYENHPSKPGLVKPRKMFLA